MGDQELLFGPGIMIAWVCTSHWNHMPLFQTKFPLEFLGYRVYLLYCSSLGFPLRRAIFFEPSAISPDSVPFWLTQSPLET